METADNASYRLTTAAKDAPAMTTTCTECGKTIRLVNSPETGTYCTCLDEIKPKPVRRNAKSNRAHVVSLLAGEYFALHFGYQDIDTTRSNALEILANAPLGSRKETWIMAADTARHMLLTVPNSSVHWALMQYGMIYLGYEI